MHSVEKIKQYIAELPEGTTFAAGALRSFASTDNIRQIMTRLVKSGEINRVARGIFVKPKYTPSFGLQLTSAIDVARAIAESTGETIAVHGAEAARQLRDGSKRVNTRPVFHSYF